MVLRTTDKRVIYYCVMNHSKVMWFKKTTALWLVMSGVGWAALSQEFPALLCVLWLGLTYGYNMG